jgi:hypothetical protein
MSRTMLSLTIVGAVLLAGADGLTAAESPKDKSPGRKGGLAGEFKRINADAD